MGICTLRNLGRVFTRHTFFAKHTALFLSQILLLCLAVKHCGGFKGGQHTSEFQGHLGPVTFLLFMGALEMSTLPYSQQPWTAVEVQEFEARVCIGGSLLYVLASAWMHAGSKLSLNIDYLNSYSFREQQHIALMYVILACGILSINLANRADAIENLPMVLFAAAFAFFTALHEQPLLMGNLLHYGTCASILLHAMARVGGFRFSAGAFLYLGGCNFFFGQYSIVMFLDHKNTNPSSVLLAVVAYAIAWINLYAAAFPNKRTQETDNTFFHQEVSLLGKQGPARSAVATGSDKEHYFDDGTGSIYSDEAREPLEENLTREL